MKRIIFTIIFFSAAIIFEILAQSPFVLPESRVQEGARLILVNDYKNAEVFWDRVILEHPNIPDGYFFKLMNLHVRMIDYENYDQFAFFQSYCDTVENIAENYSERTGNAYYRYFYSGIIHFYQAFILTKMDKNITAFMKAREGSKALEKCMKLDSTIYEPYPLLGAYKYWKSKKAGFLRAIRFVRDERTIGLKYLEKGMKKSVALNVFARDQLAWIYIDAGEPYKALKLTSANLSDFNQSRSLKWTYSHSLMALQLWEKALVEFIRLHWQYQALLPEAVYNYLYTFKKILILSEKTEDKGKEQEQVRQLVENYQTWKNKHPGTDKDTDLIKEIDQLLDMME